MQNKTTLNFENLKRMSEIAHIYEITKQRKKSDMYHRNIIRICDEYPKNEKMLQYKIHSLNCLNKPYKSLETTNELLSMNPYNLTAILNIAKHIKEGLDV